jgi:cardiolipin synthase
MVPTVATVPFDGQEPRPAQPVVICAPSWAAGVDLVVEGANFYPRILEDMERAESSIHIVQFGFKPGKVGDRLADVLSRKARAGVAVRICVDANGSDTGGASRPMFQRLVDAGADVVVNDGVQLFARQGPIGAQGPLRLNLRGIGHIDHRKLVVVDGRTGWVGAGFEDHFWNGEFHDLFLRLGGTVVSQLQLVAVASFRGHGVRVDDVAALFPDQGSAPADAVPAVVLHNAPGPVRPVSDAIAELIESARDTLDIANPYVTDRSMVRRLNTAGRRGVRVRVVVPAQPNNWACGAAQRHHYRHLLAAGVEIVEYPRMVHAKAFVRDGCDVVVGTCNLDAWSLRRSFEVAVRLQSPALAEEFAREFFTPAIAISRPGRVATTVASRARNALFACLSPLL